MALEAPVSVLEFRRRLLYQYAYINPSMNAPGSSGGCPTLLEPQKAALVKLLSDEDPAIYQTIRKTILSYGAATAVWLKPYTWSNDPLCRRRSREIIEYLGRHAADNQFLAFCLNQGEEFDLEEAVFLLVQTKFPTVNVQGYRALLEEYSRELKDRILPGTNPEATLATINQYLFTDLGFYGNERNYYEPDNSYLNRVIDRRTGNPISLSLIYLFLARRLSLPVTGIGMPGHFLLRYQDSQREIYLDPFHHGRLLTKANCIQYLMQTGAFQEAYLSPVSSRRILLRICSNLHQIFTQQQAAEEVDRFQRYIVALAK